MLFTYSTKMFKHVNRCYNYSTLIPKSKITKQCMFLYKIQLKQKYKIKRIFDAMCSLTLNSYIACVKLQYKYLFKYGTLKQRFDC